MIKKPSSRKGGIFAVGGGTPQQHGLTSVEEFLVRERRWRPRAPLAGRRQQHAAAVVRVAATAAAADEGGQKALIGVFGGGYQEGDTWTRLASCELFDVSQNRWHRLPDLPQQRAGPAAACLPGDSRVFVFGGHDDSIMHDSVVFCRLRADWQQKAITASTAEFWLPAARMRTARLGLAAVPFRGKVLVAGGYNSRKEDVNVVELFSPPDANCQFGQWTEVAGMRQPRRNIYLLTSGDVVFALGNYSEPRNTVEVFTAPEGSADMGNDFTAWIWSTKSPVETFAWILGAAGARI